MGWAARSKQQATEQAGEVMTGIVNAAASAITLAELSADVAVSALDALDHGADAMTPQERANCRATIAEMRTKLAEGRAFVDTWRTAFSLRK